jgi:hypothetical protein
MIFRKPALCGRCPLMFKIEKQILTDEIEDPEFLNFAVENISELFLYLATGRVNIRVCRDITGQPDEQ